jgi:hypothetical protein
MYIGFAREMRIKIHPDNLQVLTLKLQPNHQPYSNQNNKHQTWKYTTIPILHEKNGHIISGNS